MEIGDRIVVLIEEIGRSQPAAGARYLEGFRAGTTLIGLILLTHRFGFDGTEAGQHSIGVVCAAFRTWCGSREWGKRGRGFNWIRVGVPSLHTHRIFRLQLAGTWLP